MTKPKVTNGRWELTGTVHNGEAHGLRVNLSFEVGNDRFHIWRHGSQFDSVLYKNPALGISRGDDAYYQTRHLDPEAAGNAALIEAAREQAGHYADAYAAFMIREGEAEDLRKAERAEQDRQQRLKDSAAEGWITNDPEIAKRLRTIDELHADARFGARDLSLKGKLEAYRKADIARSAAYARIQEDLK